SHGPLRRPSGRCARRRARGRSGRPGWSDRPGRSGWSGSCVLLGRVPRCDVATPRSYSPVVLLSSPLHVIAHSRGRIGKPSACARRTWCNGPDRRRGSTGSGRRGSLRAMGETRKPTLITSVQRALRLMEVVASRPSGAPAKQRAREARLTLATAYHLLRTLAHEGYATRLSDGVWVLGERVEALHGRSRAQQVLARIRPALADLRDELGAAAYFSMHMDDEIRLIDIADGPRAPRVDVWVGFEDAAHATAIGKCVLSQFDEDRRREYLAR